MASTRRLAAILAADVAGYSRLMVRLTLHGAPVLRGPSEGDRDRSCLGADIRRSAV